MVGFCYNTMCNERNHLSFSRSLSNSSSSSPFCSFGAYHLCAKVSLQLNLANIGKHKCHLQDYIKFGFPQGALWCYPQCSSSTQKEHQTPTEIIWQICLTVLFWSLENKQGPTSKRTEIYVWYTNSIHQGCQLTLCSGLESDCRALCGSDSEHRASCGLDPAQEQGSCAGSFSSSLVPYATAAAPALAPVRVTAVPMGKVAGGWLGLNALVHPPPIECHVRQGLRAPDSMAGHSSGWIEWHRGTELAHS